MHFTRTIALLPLALLAVLTSCGHEEKKSEELTSTEFSSAEDTTKYPLKGNATFKQLNSTVNSVILTGLDSIRLINIYKVRPGSEKNVNREEGTTYYRKLDDNTGEPSADEDNFCYFMPGMDVISGYNLINVGHYDMAASRLSYFFQKPVLVRNLYFPGIKRDSLKGVPVSRDFFLASVYDQDTNNDSLINKKDLRRMYHFDKRNTTRTALLPERYSAIRSTYDYRNDVMYIYAKYDANKNGTTEKTEPVSIFYIDLKTPSKARKMI